METWKKRCFHKIFFEVSSFWHISQCLACFQKGHPQMVCSIGKPEDSLNLRENWIPYLRKNHKNSWGNDQVSKDIPEVVILSNTLNSYKKSWDSKRKLGNALMIFELITIMTPFTSFTILTFTHLYIYTYSTYIYIHICSGSDCMYRITSLRIQHTITIRIFVFCIPFNTLKHLQASNQSGKLKAFHVSFWSDGPARHRTTRSRVCFKVSSCGALIRQSPTMGSFNIPPSTH